MKRFRGTGHYVRRQRETKSDRSKGNIQEEVSHKWGRGELSSEQSLGLKFEVGSFEQITVLRSLFPNKKRPKVQSYALLILLTLLRSKSPQGGFLGEAL